MTPQKLISRVRELLDEERDLKENFSVLTVPELMHIKAGLERALLDAISDDATPCPHSGTRWTPTLEAESRERCGQCGRVIEEIKA